MFLFFLYMVTSPWIESTRSDCHVEREMVGQVMWLTTSLLYSKLPTAFTVTKTRSVFFSFLLVVTQLEKKERKKNWKMPRGFGRARKKEGNTWMFLFDIFFFSAYVCVFYFSLHFWARAPFSSHRIFIYSYVQGDDQGENVSKGNEWDEEDGSTRHG